MTTRAGTRSVGAAALALLVVALVASPAEAAAYRYWTYWQSTGSSEWEFGRVGPASALPEDGAVEGWSFRVSEEGGAADAAPSTAPDFEALCGDTPRRGGIKRIGLIIDPGVPALAPDGEAPISSVSTCVSIEDDATGYDVLRSVLEVRTENGLICALGDYPSRECAPVLDDAEVAEIRDRETASVSSAEATEGETGVLIIHGNARDADDSLSGQDATVSGQEREQSPQTGPTATIVVAVLLILGAAVLALSRRRRDRSDA